MFANIPIVSKVMSAKKAEVIVNWPHAWLHRDTPLGKGQTKILTCKQMAWRLISRKWETHRLKCRLRISAPLLRIICGAREFKTSLSFLFSSFYWIKKNLHTRKHHQSFGLIINDHLSENLTRIQLLSSKRFDFLQKSRQKGRVHFFLRSEKQAPLQMKFITW